MATAVICRIYPSQWQALAVRWRTIQASILFEDLSQSRRPGECPKPAPLRYFDRDNAADVIPSAG
jgi:hypothetical protein